METATQVLIIIVSIVLTVFLVVAIILILLGIKVMKQLKLIANNAEKAVDSVSNAGYMLRNVSGPLALVKLVRNAIKQHKQK